MTYFNYLKYEKKKILLIKILSSQSLRNRRGLNEKLSRKGKFISESKSLFHELYVAPRN